MQAGELWIWSTQTGIVSYYYFKLDWNCGFPLKHLVHLLDGWSVSRQDCDFPVKHLVHLLVMVSR